MFRITILVEDNKLAKALNGLAGVGFNLEVLPVDNAEVEPKSRRVKEAGVPTGQVMVLEMLQEHAASDPDNNKIFSAELVASAKAKWKATAPQVYYGIARAAHAGILKSAGKGVHILNRSKL